MHQRYLLIVSDKRQQPDSADIRAKMTEYFRASLCGLEVACFSDTLIPGPWLAIENGMVDSQVITITEGFFNAQLSGDRRIQPGTYNQITIDGQAGEVVLRNDVLASLPCFFAFSGNQLAIANNLSLIQTYFRLTLDMSGVAQRYLLAGWTIDERTIFGDAYIAAGGSEYTFFNQEKWRFSRKRLTKSWTETTHVDSGRLVDRTCELWDQAITRTAKAADGPIGIMLSGGLDSRMVAAGLKHHDVPLICLTHGNLQGDEARIAEEVCNALGATRITNALDNLFPFEKLNIPRIQEILGGLFNPIWDSSGALLFTRGIRHFTSGAGLEGLLGGRIDSDPVRRFIKNLITPIPGLLPQKKVTEADILKLAQPYVAVAAMRRRNYTQLLAQPFRDIIEDYARDILNPIQERLALMAKDGNPTKDQLAERFVYEQSEKQVLNLQELQLAIYGKPHFPTYDLDLVEYLSNVPPAMKYDHHLYYQIINRLYPKMAAITVTNLGTPVNRSRLSLEVIRAFRILQKKRLSSWVNFEDWIAHNGRLEQYMDCFLNYEHFFDPDQIIRYFTEVRDGRRRLYDGNETLSFLSLAMAIGVMK